MSDKYPVLVQLKNENNHEFRHQIIAELKRISSEKEVNDFYDLLNQFKKEFIQDSYFYIDQLNEVIKNLFYIDNINPQYIYKPLLFLSQIGDNNTLELIKKNIGLFAPYNKFYEELIQSCKILENRLKRMEEEADDYKLYPMTEIIDQWME